VVKEVVNNITIVQHKIWKAMLCVGWMTLTTTRVPTKSRVGRLIEKT
jgi:hypothetical protein